MTKPTILLLAAAVALAGCSRSDPEPEVANTMTVEELPEAPATVAEPLPEPVATPVEQNSAAELPPEERPEPDAQMLDDASATGMTSRVERDAEEAPANGR
ncbi:hypothetical protein ASG29_02570 [Sphingomonas sp. Leaf412]|nr:hypothetical protein ASG29_02570 [Sphingomonas sp. Leaf412]